MRSASPTDKQLVETTVFTWKLGVLHFLSSRCRSICFACAQQNTYTSSTPAIANHSSA
eukprot:jgi/Pico_ML_1/55430/g1116.t1